VEQASSQIGASRHTEPASLPVSGASWRRLATAGGCLAALAGGCASQVTGAGNAGHRHAASTASATAPGGEISGLAAHYLAIAVPANRELDQEVDAYDDHAHGSLARAESALRAEAATERRFDQLLLRIDFPEGIDATARALVAVNQRRVALTELQAQSASTAELLSFTSSHKSADAGVEAEVRIIRRQLGLPPPENS
jgi:hypothetical protein